MGDMETVMNRLSAHARRLQEQPVPSGDADRALMVESLALMSEALLKVGRDVRHLRNKMADKD